MSFISNINNNNNNNNRFSKKKNSNNNNSKLCAVFILFDKEAKKLLQTTARELSNKCATIKQMCSRKTSQLAYMIFYLL